MKKKFAFFILLFFCFSSFAQSYNLQNVAMGNYLKRMYSNAPFDGVRIFENYESVYLLSVVALEKGKYPNESAQDRVASVKAMSQASRYFNGSTIDSSIIIHTEEHIDGSFDASIIEEIKEQSMGYVKELELITSFDRQDGRKVYIFGKRTNLTPQKK